MIIEFSFWFFVVVGGSLLAIIRFNEALNRAEAADRPEPTGWELE